MTAPIIHVYDRETGEYLETQHAQPSPLEPGVWLSPSYSTREAPPRREGHVACWRDGEWVEVEDHRKKTIWKGDERRLVTSIGPVPDGWSLTQPERKETPEDEAAKQDSADWAEMLKEWRANRPAKEIRPSRR